MGWNINAGGTVDTSSPLEPIDLSSLSMAANPTTRVDFEGNIDRDDPNPFDYDITVFDSLGGSHTLTFTFTRTANPREYSYTVSSPDPAITITNGGGTVNFTNTGELNTHTPAAPTMTIGGLDGAADIVTSVNFDANKFTYNSNKNNVGHYQDGYQAGSILSVSVNSSGEVIGSFSNGQDQKVAALAIATFINPQGLEKAGKNMYTSSWNSGEPQINLAGVGERGEIAGSSLEMSNVDLAKEFTEMIVAQRGFQANSKIITTSDEMLQELVNLKR